MDSFGKLVRIEPTVLADILLAIDLCPVEISGLAKVRQEGDSLLIWGEPEVFFQKCSIGGTEFDLEALGIWNHKMMKSGQIEEINEFRLWWHSHVFSASLFSSIDRALIESWAESPTKWRLSFVGNKFGELLFQVDIYGKKRKTIHPEIKCTERISKQSLRALMLERSGRMKKLIDERVSFDDKEIFEKILRGVFNER